MTETADTFPERLENAYQELKGSTEHVPIPTAQTVLDIVSTARTTQHRITATGNTVDAVTAYFKSDATATVPKEVTDIADRHDLVEIARKHEYNEKTLESVTFIKAEALPEA